MAMQWHPDKHKWDKNAEAKFKEINEAYTTLKDSKKKKQYDTFGGAGDQFSGFSGWQGYSGWSWFSWFEDIFSQFWWQQRTRGQGAEFDDLFQMFWNQWRPEPKAKPKKEEPPKVDVEKIYEVPVMDLILWTKLNIETVYNEQLKLKIPEWTKPGTKFKISWKWRKTWNLTGDMYVIIEAKMPKSVPEDVKKLLESIKYRL